MVLAGAIVIQRAHNLGQLPVKNYSSPGADYSVSYPRAWQTGDLAGGKVSQTKDDVFIGSLSISPEIKAPKKFDDFIEQDVKGRIKAVMSKYQRFEVLSEKAIRLQNKPAYYIEVVTEQDGATHPDHTVLLYVDRGNGKVASLVMGVNEDVWEQNPRAYRAVVRSFKIHS